MLAQLKIFLAHAEAVRPPVEALLDPALVPLFVGARHHEVLHLHHLELAVAEDEISGGYFITEGAADLGDAEWQLAAGWLGDVVVNYKQALRRLGPQG